MRKRGAHAAGTAELASARVKKHHADNRKRLERTFFLPAVALVVAVVSAFGVTAVVAPTADAADCPDVRFVGVRGSGDSQDDRRGMGRQVEDVFVRLAGVADLGTVHGVGLVYPAVDVRTGFTQWQAAEQGQPGGSVSAYARSVDSGVASLTAEVEASVAECPDTPVVLGGHSQGAEVIDSTLRHNRPAFEHIAGVVLFGDPTFVSDRPYVRGTFEPRNGLLSEIGATPDPAYWGQIASYCRKNDAVCQAGPRPGLADLLDLFRGEHSNYIDGETEQAAAFLVDQLR